MKKNMFIILILSIIVLLSVAVFIGYYQISSTTENPIYAKIATNDFSENIECWQNENGDYYLFLPSYANLSQLSLHKEISTDLFLDEVKVTDGMSGEILQLNHTYELTYSIYGKKNSKILTILQSGDIPTMHIDTFSGSMEYIHEKKGNQESAVMRVYDMNGSLCNSANIEAINGRGNSTWQWYDKKPYSIHFASDIDLLGMGLAKEWILLANATDKSNVRNKAVYDFASEFGLKYSPDSEWVDLYLNGAYAGLYLLCERNEIYENRVEISGDNVSLVSLELESRLQNRKLAYIETTSGQSLRIHSPSNVNADSLIYISNSWQSVENAILSENGVDSVTGKHWQELIDVESWARKYLIEEVFGNIDAGFLSQYFYMDKNGKAYAGPVWDYDHSLGSNDHWELENSNILLINEYTKNNRLWFYTLSQKKEFCDCVISIYQSEFIPLIEDSFLKNIDGYEYHLSKSANMNSIRWFGNQNWMEDVGELISYIKERLDFFNEFWESDTKFYVVRLQDGERVSYQMISQGENVSSLPILEDKGKGEFLGWYYSDTDQPFDSEMPICENIELYAKREAVPTSKTKTIVKITPIVIISILFIILLSVEIKRNIRKRRN